MEPAKWESYEIELSLHGYCIEAKITRILPEVISIQAQQLSFKFVIINASPIQIATLCTEPQLFDCLKRLAKL